MSVLNTLSALGHFDQDLRVSELSGWPEKQRRVRDKTGISCFCVITCSVWTGRTVPFHSAVLVKEEGLVTHRLDRIGRTADDVGFCGTGIIKYCGAAG